MVNTTYLAVFVLYLLATFAIGIYAWRRTSHTPSDFYLAGRRIGTLVLTFTIMATIFSSWSFFGIGAASSGTGLGVLLFAGFILFFQSVFYYVVGSGVNAIGRGLDIVTPSEYLIDRYESKGLGLLYAFAALIFLTAFVSVQIIGGGIALEILFEIPYEWGILVMTAFMAAYIHIAGMRGVIWSDLLQGVMMFAVMIAIFLVALGSVGGGQLSGRVLDASPRLFDVNAPWTPLYVFTIGAIFIVGVPTYPQVYQRFLGARSTVTLKRMALLYPVIGFLFYFAAVALGVWSVGYVTDPPNPDYVIALLMQALTNDVVVALVLSAALAALMSTADSVILSLGSIISRDMYTEYVDPAASDERQTQVAQAAFILIILLALAFAVVQPAGIFALGALSVAGFTTITPALYAGTFWSGATKEGAIASIAVGLVVVLGFFFDVIPGTLTFGMHYGFVGLLVSTAIYAVVSAVTSAPSDSTVERHVVELRG